jgi:elongation factor Tu
MQKSIYRVLCLAALAMAIVGYRSQPGAAADAAFSMVVADVFTISGKGVVVTGRIEAGSVSVNDEVCLSGDAGKRTVTIEGIERFKEIRDSATAGEDVGLLLGGVEKSDVAKNDRLTGGKC